MDMDIPRTLINHLYYLPSLSIISLTIIILTIIITIIIIIVL